MRDLAHYYRNKKFWDGDAGRKRILPFPGRFPTRWKVVYYENLKDLLVPMKAVFQYIGKPSQEIINKVATFKQKGYIYLLEFDRLGAFRYAYRPTPKDEYFVQGYAANVCYAYYPWSAYADEFFCMWRHPLFIKRVLFNGNQFNMYSPYEKMSGLAETQMLREHREWLVKTNLLSKRWTTTSSPQIKFDKFAPIAENPFINLEP
jgi:hypothetical protein